MPSLVAFGHKWGVGSDDLAVPAVLVLTASVTWLLTFGRAVIYMSDSLPAVVWAADVRRLYVSMTIIHSLSLLPRCCLIHNSFLGTVINTRPRRRAAYYLTIKLVLEGLSIYLSLASVYLVVFTDTSAAPEQLVKTFRNAFYGFWFTTIMSSLVTWHILNPSKRKPDGADYQNVRDLEHTEALSETIMQTWTDRFNAFGKHLRIDDHPALNKLGKLFSEYIQGLSDVDLVATDVIAALLILNKEQKQRFDKINKSLDLSQPKACDLQPGSHDPQPESHAHQPRSHDLQPGSHDLQPGSHDLQSGSHDPQLESPDPQPWMTVTEAAHYMKYAAGSYGWPMYIWSSPLALCGLAGVLVRSRYLPKNTRSNIIDDSHLMSNTMVIKMVTGLTDDQLILVTFHNKLFEVPFYVALDHVEKSVIVAIRGTLSLEDILTDLAAFDNVSLDIPGVPDATAHQGMYSAASYIMGRLLGDESEDYGEKGLLKLALQRVENGTAEDYKLVIVGHSLGAGVAAILALLMKRHEYYGPRLWCFAYSPPGGLLSESASRYAKSFVCSVVLGDDIVSRIGLINIHDLIVKILSTIRDLDVPKHRIFQDWFRNLLNKALGVSENEFAQTKDKHSWSHDPLEQKDVQDFQKCLDASISWNKLRMEHREGMYLPGCVMYIEPLSQTRFHCRFVPMNCYLFGEIILSKGIVKHHTPWAVLRALRQLAQQCHKK